MDSLQLQITAESGRAVTSVNQLISTLERLDGVNLGNLKGQISSMSSAIQSLTGINAESLKSVSSGIRSLANSLTKLSSAGNSASMIQSIANIRVTNAEQLAELSKSIRSLGYVAADNAAKNLPIFTQELKNLFTTLSQVPKVNANVTGLLNTITNFNNSMRSVTTTMKTASVGTTSFSNVLPTFNRNMTKTHHTVRGLAGQLGKFWATFYIFIRGFQQIGKAIDLSSSLTEVENVVNQTFGGMRTMIDDFAQDSIRQFGMSELALKQYASRFQAMGSSLGITGSMLQKTSAILGDQAELYGKNTKSMAEMSMNLTKLTADMASFYDVEQSAVAEDLYSVFTGQTRSLRQYGIDLTQANLKEWAMKKGLDANIESMTQAQKAALRYAYTLDAANFAMGDFARTSNTWHNQITILKANMQQLAILIGTGFINVLKPFVTAFNNAMASVLKAVTAVLNALGKIFGWKYEVNLGGVTTDLEDAAGYADDTADGLGDAAKNAKKLKNQLMSFDKLNVITSPSDSSGSGSGSGSGGAANVDTSDIISKVKTGEGIFDSDINDLYELGQKISEKIRESLANIDWDKVFKAADKFGRNLAMFLNGLITPETFAMIGGTAANVLNTVLHGLDSFGKTFNWDGFGRSLAAGLNSFFKTFDWLLLADTINVWASGLLDALIAALENVDWREIGNKIGEFLVAIDFKTILKKVGKAIWLAINGAFELYKGMFETAPLETALLTLVGVTKLLKVDSVKKFITAVKNGIGVANKFVAALQGGASVTSALTLTGFPKLARAITTAKAAFEVFAFNMRTGVGILGSLDAGLVVIRTALGAVGTALVGLAGGFAEFFLVTDGVKDLTKAINGGENSLVLALGEIASGVAIGAGALMVAFGPAGLVIGALVGVTAAIVGISQAFRDIDTENYETAVVDALTNPGGQDVSELIEDTKAKIISVGDGFEKVSEKSDELENAKDNVSNLTDEINLIKTKMDAGVISTEEGTQQLIEAFKNLSSSIRTEIETAADVVYSAFGEGGSLRKYFEMAGADVDGYVEHTAEAVDLTKAELTRLEEALSNPNLSANERSAIEERIEAIKNSTSGLETSVQNLKNTSEASKLNWASLIDSENGVLAIEDVKEALDPLMTSATDTGDKFKSAFDLVNESMTTVGNNTDAIDSLAKLNDAFASLNAESAESITELTNTMQTDLIDTIPQMIESAANEWEKKSPGEKFVRSLLYGEDEGTYIQKQLQAYQENTIDPISEYIETSLEDLGIEGAGWAGDASQDIINGLFDTETVDFGNGRVRMESELKTGWEDIFKNIKDPIVEKGKSLGKDAIDGLLSGATTQISSTAAKNSANKVADETESNLRTSFDSHSPAKKMNPLGKDIILGIFDGFSLVDFGAKMTEWWNSNVEPWFTLEKWSTLGQGIADGLSQKWEEIKEWWQTSTFSVWWEEDVTPWFSIEKWSETVSSIGDSLKDEWGDADKQWKTDLKNWWEKDVSPMFTLKKWQDLTKNVSKALSGALKDGANGGIDALNKLIGAAESAVNMIVGALNSIQVSIPSWVPGIGGQSFGLHLSNVSIGRLSRFENGGFPDIGSVFIAGEAGAEMVGNINGKTGVASGQEITGIRDAIENSAYREQEMMRRAIGLLEGIYAKEFSISADDVASSTRNVADEYFSRTGRPYFAT